MRVFLDNPADLPLQNIEDDRSIVDILPESPFPDTSKRKHITKLTVNVTQACNLKCEYCYAEYGLYGQRTPPSEIDAFLETLKSVVSHYHTIDRIQFFGGEPLLAPDKIKAGCRFFRKAAEAGFISKVPAFSAVTNGVFLTKKEVLSLLKEEDFHVTISCDGPPCVTDALRPGSKGQSTHALLSAGLDAARDAGISIAIEATYTKTHQELGVSVIDVLDHMADEFGIPSVHISPAAYSPWGDYRPMRPEVSSTFFDAARLSVKRVIQQSPGVLEATMGVLDHLNRRERVKGYCPAYTSQLSLDVKGDVYPCFVSMSRLDTRLGNLVDDAWPTKQCDTVYSRY